MLLRLIYFSERCVECDDAAFDRIASASERRNTSLGVTGVLIADRRCFLQVLEGHRATVSDLFGARILPDRHHKSPVIVEAGAILGRHFPTWETACFEPPNGTERLYRIAAGGDSFEPWAMGSNQIAAFALDLRRRLPPLPPRDDGRPGGDFVYLG